MIKTVLFDMDGVIVDTEPVHHYAYHQHFKQLGIEVSPEMYASFTGNSTKNIFEKLKSQFSLSQSVSELVETKRHIFNEAFDHNTDLYLIAGVRDLIETLHANDIGLLVVSSSAHVTINRIFTRFDLHRYFQHIVSGEDFVRSKPDPAIFLKAVELSGNAAHECVVIEDSTNGIKGAKAAGICCVGYDSPNSKMQDYTLADRVITHFNELDAHNPEAWFKPAQV